MIYLVQNNLQQYIASIVIALTLKDLLIDTNIIKLRREKGPWPDKPLITAKRFSIILYKVQEEYLDPRANSYPSP